MGTSTHGVSGANGHKHTRCERREWAQAHTVCAAQMGTSTHGVSGANGHKHTRCVRRTHGGDGGGGNNLLSDGGLQRHLEHLNKVPGRRKLSTCAGWFKLHRRSRLSNQH
eukprot:7109146-Prymnesium_polylepis.3